MNIRRLTLSLLLVPVLTFPTESVADPAAPDSDLHLTVLQLDRSLFDAFNACELGAVSDLVAPDLEFYHDRTGLERGRTPFLAALRNNVCGKVRRELIPGTLQVYPLAGYGAVEMGTHRFCDARRFEVCDPERSGDADFVMLWRETEAGWILSRVISYDHIDRPD